MTTNLRSSFSNSYASPFFALDDQTIIVLGPMSSRDRNGPGLNGSPGPSKRYSSKAADRCPARPSCTMSAANRRRRLGDSRRCGTRRHRSAQRTGLLRPKARRTRNGSASGSPVNRAAVEISRRIIRRLRFELKEPWVQSTSPTPEASVKHANAAS
jgi:hypothetical protein